MVRFCIPVSDFHKFNKTKLFRIAVHFHELQNTNNKNQICGKTELYLSFAQYMKTNFAFVTASDDVAGEVYKNGTSDGFMRLFQEGIF